MFNILNKVWVGLTSRTVWSIAALVLLNGVPSVRELIPPEWLSSVDFVLGILAVYFRVNPQAGIKKE